MTVAKKMFYLASSLLLGSAISVAQSAQSSTPSVGTQDQDSSMSAQAAGAVLRGCLSGSDGNYTLTDHNGTIYHLVGAASQLRDSVGHELAVTGTPDSQRTGASDDTTTNTASSFQVTGVRDVASTCDTRGSSRSGAMSENPNTDSHPKGAPGEGAPPKPQSDTEPHLMAMLQQPSSTDSGSMGSQSSSTVSSPSATDQSSQTSTTGTGQTSTPPPVTSQTPAATQSPTDPNAQMGTGSANPTGTGAAAGTTPAQQTGSSAGASSTTPSSDTSATTTVTSGSSTSTTGSTSSSGASAPPQSASPQNSQNDQNKPLYERQATDVPWASHSGSTTTTTTANPNGSSSTTTTTTTPEPKPQR